MIIGLSAETFTLLHVVISLIGIASGLVVLFCMLGGRHLNAMTAIFLATTVLTSVTGFMFHSQSFGPPHIVGVISLVVLALALLALYAFDLRGAWLPIYVITAVLALYLNVFVGVVQAFQKITVLAELAPTQSEPPFVIAQSVVLLLFLVLGGVAVRGFHPSQQALA